MENISVQYSEGTMAAEQQRFMVRGALTLYLDFINLFLMLLRVMGNRR